MQSHLITTHLPEWYEWKMNAVVRHLETGRSGRLVSNVSPSALVADVWWKDLKRQEEVNTNEIEVIKK